MEMTMAQSARSSIQGVSSIQCVEVVEIVDVAFAADCGYVELAVRADDGNTFLLPTPQTALAAAFGQLSRRAAMELEMSTDGHVAKLNAPVGEWEVVQSVGGAIPTFECRIADGRGVAVGLTYDPITAIPRLQVAIELRRQRRVKALTITIERPRPGD
jgi:hypothetical protein